MTLLPTPIIFWRRNRDEWFIKFWWFSDNILKWILNLKLYLQKNTLKTCCLLGFGWGGMRRLKWKQSQEMKRNQSRPNDWQWKTEKKQQRNFILNLSNWEGNAYSFPEVSRILTVWAVSTLYTVPHKSQVMVICYYKRGVGI